MIIANYSAQRNTKKSFLMKLNRGLLERMQAASLLLVLLLLIISCNQSEVLETSPTNSGNRVYLTLSLGNYNTPPPSTRNSSPSINTDGTLFEDRVRELVIYIFDSTTGEGIDFRAYTGLPLKEPATFVVDFPEGTYDFYFIANMPTEGEDASSSIGNREAADEYLKKLRTLDESLFTGPINDGAGFSLFPMARVYRNQTIKKTSGSAGSSENNPIYFRPTNEHGVAEDCILLTRAVAKIETILKGEGAEYVTSVQLVNGVNQYSLLKPDNQSTAKNENHNIFRKTEKTGNHILYTPEVIQSTSPKWDDDYTGKDINYIILTLKSGRTYKVPVASNYITGNYLDFVKSENATFNVLRNNHYQFTLNIPQDVKDIEVEIKVLPWTVMESGMDFGKATYAIELVNPIFENENENKTILLHQKDSLKVKFQLHSPRGALWKATITNGADFKLSPAEEASGAVGGIADNQKTYKFYIHPNKDYAGTNRYTEFYITVNGEEIQLIGSTEEPGPGKRYVFKQVE